MAFTATLTGAGVTAANSFGLYAGSANGLVEIVRAGDQVDVDPTAWADLRTVASFGFGFTTSSFPPGSGGQDGGRVTFTDTGFLTYTLEFTDGSSGVFTSQFTPLPEPSSALLVAVAGVAAVRVRRVFGKWGGRAEPGAAADTRRRTGSPHYTGYLGGGRCWAGSFGGGGGCG